MRPEGATEIMLIRHAPADDGGCLAGRRDVAARLPEDTELRALRAAVGAARIVASPALRCRQTAAALWPDRTAEFDARLWEQDFGGWEGTAYDALPDLGRLSESALAAHRPPGGESFADLCMRVAPALCAVAGQGGRVAVVAHAGVVRAALAQALGAVPAALRFQVAPLSLTALVHHPDGNWSIAAVNRVCG